MGYLPPETIPAHFVGLRSDFDSKGAPLGVCESLENTQSQRATTDGGAQIEKRPGTPSLSLSKAGGGSIAAGMKLGALGRELVMTDGHRLYSRQSLLAQWAERGKVCDLAAAQRRIPGGTTAFGSTQIDCDVAVSDGYACFVNSVDTGGGVGDAQWYIVEVTSDAVIASGTIALSYNVRVVSIANAFFIFAWDGTNTLTAYKIATSNPTALGSGASVAVNLNTSGLFDVTTDTTNTRMVVGYRNTTPTTTLKIWNTNQTAGTAVAYATRDPDRCVGFLDHNFADGNGYLAIGTSATGVRVLTFGSSSMTVTVDTQVDGAETGATAVTGYFSTVRNVFYTRPHATLPYNDRIAGWSNGSSFTVMRSLAIAGRAFSIAGKRYLLASYDGALFTSANQRSIFLLELEPDATAMTQVTVAGFLVNGNAGRRARTFRSVGGIAAVSATAAIAAVPLLDFPTVLNAFAGNPRHVLTRISLDWSGTLTGAPVAFNGGLYLPGAAAKVFDGLAVTEAGFMAFPEAPTLSQGAGGSLTTLGTYEYCAHYLKVYASGRQEPSAPSTVASIALTGTNRTITVTVPTLRVTEADRAINPNGLAPEVKVAIYRRLAGGTFKLRTVLTNDVTADVVTLSDTALDSLIAPDEPLYTDEGSVDHSWPPAVRSYCVHRNRLFAISGDGAVWFTKETTEGDATAFSDSFRVLFDQADGDLTGMLSLDATLVVAKRSSLWGIIGEGPSIGGDNPFAYPAPLPGSAGLVGPRAFVLTTDGAIVSTAKGKAILDRGGGLTILPGSDAYDALTVTGGVVLDDRPMALLTTSDGRTLCWDWQLKTWHTWTGQAAVAACMWQNLFVWLESNGKVHVETPGAYSDDAGAYTMSVKLAWIDLVRAYVRGLRVVGEAMADCTLQALVSYNYDTGNADASKSLALTASGPKAPWVIEPDQGYLESLQLLLTETSTTAGLKLTKALLELSRLAGGDKYSGAHYLR